MKRDLNFGLGWLPDLPDLRDKSLKTALRNLAKDGAGQSVPKAKKKSNEAGAKYGQVDLHTYHGWLKSSGRVEKGLERTKTKIGGKDLSEMLHVAKQWAFPGEGKRPNAPLLLSAPPDNALPAVDLRPFMSPIENQLQIGSCTAHAVIALAEYLQIATRGDYIDGSRLFLYKATRNLLQLKGDTGAYIREAIKSLRLFGTCPEYQWVYDQERFDVEPSAFCYAYASNYKAMRYYRLANLEEIKRSLSQGYPVAFGFTCFESLFTDRVRETGEIPFPTLKERVCGGHAVLAVGYRDKRAPSGEIREADASWGECPEEHVIVRNSWGSNWGANGYGFLPYRYFYPEEQVKADDRQGVLPLADDFWTVTQMEIPELEETAAAPFLVSGPCHGCGKRPRAALGSPPHGAGRRPRNH